MALRQVCVLLRCLLHQLCFDHLASFQGLEGAVVRSKFQIVAYYRPAVRP